MNLQFMGVLLGAAVTIISTSLAWPRLTEKERPIALQKVHDIVLQTPQGKAAAEILGVQNEEGVEPINVASVAASVASSVTSAVTNKAQEVVTRQAVQQITRQIDQLPPEQKSQLQEIFCKP